jgi:hypothetical protein
MATSLSLVDGDNVTMKLVEMKRTIDGIIINDERYLTLNGNGIVLLGAYKQGQPTPIESSSSSSSVEPVPPIYSSSSGGTGLSSSSSIGTTEVVLCIFAIVVIIGAGAFFLRWRRRSRDRVPLLRQNTDPLHFESYSSTPITPPSPRRKKKKSSRKKGNSNGGTGSTAASGVTIDVNHSKASPRNDDQLV